MKCSCSRRRSVTLTSCASRRWSRLSLPQTPRFGAAMAAGCGRRPAPGPPATQQSRVSQVMAAPCRPSPPPWTHLQLLLGPVGSRHVPELSRGGGDLPDDASAFGRAPGHKRSQELTELTCMSINDTVVTLLLRKHTGEQRFHHSPRKGQQV